MEGDEWWELEGLCVNPKRVLRERERPEIGFWCLKFELEEVETPDCRWKERSLRRLERVGTPALPPRGIV